jgi:hypothetical protein
MRFLVKSIVRLSVFGLFCLGIGILVLCSRNPKNRPITLPDPEGYSDGVAWTDWNHRLWLIQIVEKRLSLNVIENWSGSTPITWLSGRRGHGPIMTGFGPPPKQPVDSRVFGLRVVNSYYRAGLESNGICFLKDSPDNLPLKVIRSVGDGDETFPARLSPYLLCHFVDLGSCSDWAFLSISPMALWMCVFAAPRVKRIVNRSKERRGKCSSCLYDLRASKDRCPECGTPIPPAKSKPSPA